MNKVYKLIWSATQNAWIVCSELGKKKKSKSVIISCGVLIGITFSGHSFATCNDQIYAIQGAVTAGGESTCNATLSGYYGNNTGWVINKSTLNFILDTVEIKSNASASTQTLGIGGANSGGLPTAGDSTLNAKELVVYSGYGANARAIIIHAVTNGYTYNTLHTTGNLSVFSRNYSGGAAIQIVSSGGNVIVDKDLLIQTRNTDAFRNGGTASIKGNLSIETGISNGIVGTGGQFGRGLLNIGKFTVQGNSLIKTQISHAIENFDNGNIELNGDSTIINTVANHAININSGTITVANLTEGIVQSGDYAFILSDGGKTTLLNVDKINSSGNFIQSSGGEVDVRNGIISSKNDAISTNTSNKTNVINLKSVNLTSENGAVLKLNNTGGNTLDFRHKSKNVQFI